MTYLEKYMKEHPEDKRSPGIIADMLCPTIKMGNTCNKSESCWTCWSQEIPGTEKTEEPKKCIGLSYEEKQKLLRFVLELSDEERDHLLDYINALDELAHKQEMADNICERFLNCERKDV